MLESGVQGSDFRMVCRRTDAVVFVGETHMKDDTDHHEDGEKLDKGSNTSV